MYLITNAMKNLLRNKGRNILIASVTLAILVSTVVTLTINNAAAKIIDDIRLDLGSRVEITQDLIEMAHSGLISQSNRENLHYVSLDDFLAYAASDYLSKTIFHAEMYAWSDTFRAVDDYGETPGEATREKNDGSGEIVLIETAKLVATSDTDSLTEFGETRAVIDGRLFENLHECVISEDLAALNDLSVGDVIAFRCAYATERTYSLTVVGIYADTTDEYAISFFMNNGRFADNRRNEIITSWDTLMAAGWESNAGLNIKTEYFLKDPDDIGKYEAEVRSKGLPITYDVKINQAAYDKVAGPLSGVRGAVVTFMAVILVLGAIVLALLSFMAVRERKYEVGVLRAMGLDRAKVACGILAESVMIAVLCLVLGLGAGSLIAQPIADGMLESRVAAADRQSGDERKLALMIGGQFQTNADDGSYVPVSEIRVHLGTEVIVQIAILTLGLAVLSAMIGLVMITRYEPLAILRESTR